LNVRYLTAPDVDGLMAALRLMHAENGLFALSEGRLMETINAALDPDHAISVGVIGAPDNIEASIGLGLSQVYYSDEWHVGDFWNYVRPDYRKTDHSKKLIEFAKSFSDGMQMKLITGVVSTHRTDAKIELYRRLVGPLAGALFIYEPKGQF
jgi:GNAT superfamily N-acetyltransferase